MTKRAVLVSFVTKEDGTHLSLDDVVCSDAAKKIWREDLYYTSKPLTVEDLRKLEFDEKELADFGYHILARLAAFAETNKLM